MFCKSVKDGLGVQQILIGTVSKKIKVLNQLRHHQTNGKGGYIYGEKRQNSRCVRFDLVLFAIQMIQPLIGGGRGQKQ